MRILQLYYTSCRKGFGSGSGFQTFSMSEGITSEERQEIERSGSYIPPTDLPSQPTPTEIRNQFPVSFSFWSLKSGRFVISQSCYVGLDYTNRYGNYFCHALVLEEGRWPEYPISLWNSPFFRRSLTPQEEALETTPLPLPVLTNLPELGVLQFEQISAFLEPEERMERFKDMLNALVSYQESHRRIVLADSIEQIPMWLAALQFALPLKLAHHASFTTYSHDPGIHPALICAATRSGGRFTFSPTQRDYEYFVFDHVNQDFSSVPYQSSLTQTAEIGFSFSKDNLTAFHDFITPFTYDEINSKLDYAFLLMQLAHSGMGDLELEQIFKALDFANQYASKAVLADLMSNMAELAKTITNITLPMARSLAEFLFRASQITQQKQHQDIAFNFFYNSLDMMALEQKASADELLAFNQEMSALNEQDMTIRSLDATRLSVLGSLIQNQLAVDRVFLYLTIGCDCLKRSNKGWPEGGHWTEFVRMCLTRFLTSQSPDMFILKAFDLVKQPLFIPMLKEAWTIALQLGLAFQQCVLKGYMTWLDKNKFAIQAVPIVCIDGGLDEIVYRAFEQQLQKSSEPGTLFWGHYDTFFKRFPVYLQKYLDEAVKLLLANPNIPSETYAELLDIARQIKNPQIVSEIVIAFEDRLSIRIPSQKLNDKLRGVDTLKRDLTIRTKPDLLRLLLFIYHLNQHMILNTQQAPDYFAVIPDSLLIDSPQKRKDYLNLLLPLIFPLIKEIRHHQKVYEAVFGLSNEKPSATNQQLYLKHFSDFLQSSKDLCRERLDLFVMFCLLSPEHVRHPDVLLEVLESNKQHMDYLTKEIIKNPHYRADDRERWQRVQAMLDERQKNSFMGKISGLFQRKKAD